MSRTRIVVVASATAVVVLVAAVWWFFFRDTSPEAPTLEGAVSGVTSTTGATNAGGIEGTWTLSADGDSYVGYRVQEELASIGAKTAVGRTSQVEATLTIEGDAVTAVTVDADLTALTSDDSGRDGALRRQALETDTFPTTEFTLTAPIALPAGAADGEAIDVTGTGDLTLHGVTRSVEVPLQAQLSGGHIVVVGSLEIPFADYDIEKPSSFAVLSVEDVGTMELQLVFELAG
jgi:polyisoprenoid-binding protein YceI